MSDESREGIQRRERERSTVRSVFLGELAELGRRRNRALAEAEEEADRIARVLPDALAAGIQLTEIARVTGISRPTLYSLRDRYPNRPGSLHLAVISAIAGGVRTARELSDVIREPLGEMIQQLERDGEIEVQLIDYDEIGPDDDEPEHISDELYTLTSLGLDALEHWAFENTAEQDDGEPL